MERMNIRVRMMAPMISYRVPANCSRLPYIKSLDMKRLKYKARMESIIFAGQHITVSQSILISEGPLQILTNFWLEQCLK